MYLIKHLSFFISDTETFHSEFTFKAPLTVGQRIRSQIFVMKKFLWYLTSDVSAESSDYLGVFLQRGDKAEGLKD